MSEKICKTGYIINPSTNRCVKINGQIGKQLRDGNVNNRGNAANHIKNSWEGIHPDTSISKEAIQHAASHLDNVLDLAGKLTIYDRNKKTCGKDDIIKAIHILSKGKDFKDNELNRLEKQRLEKNKKMLEKFKK